MTEVVQMHKEGDGMSGETAIQWSEKVWNPVTGCTRVSPGCDHCYAFTLHDRRHVTQRKAAQAAGISNAAAARAQGFKLPHPPQYDVPFSRVQVLGEDRLTEPLRWRKPCRVFVNSMGDLFHKDVPDEVIDRVFAVMALAPQHTFQLLTKRPERMREWANDRLRLNDICKARPEGYLLTDLSMTWPLPNVWLGVSAENQETADGRIPHLLASPAAVRWVSYEPALGPIDFECAGHNIYHPADRPILAQTAGDTCWLCHERDGIDWIVAGGESGPGARPCDLAWLRSARDQCKAAGVAFFCKQLGSNPVTACASHGVACGGHKWPWNENQAQALGKEPRPKLRDRHGGDMAEWPEDLRVRQYPSS